MTTKRSPSASTQRSRESSRKVARAAKVGKNGYSGKALTDTMDRLTKEGDRLVGVTAAMAVLDQGVNLGGMKYKHRDELHAR